MEMTNILKIDWDLLETIEEKQEQIKYINKTLEHFGSEVWFTLNKNELHINNLFVEQLTHIHKLNKISTIEIIYTYESDGESWDTWIYCKDINNNVLDYDRKKETWE